MSISEFISNNAPFTNLPDLFNIHHSNPLGIPVAAQLIAV